MKLYMFMMWIIPSFPSKGQSVLGHPFMEVPHDPPLVRKARNGNHGSCYTTCKTLIANSRSRLAFAWGPNFEIFTKLQVSGMGHSC